MTLGNIEDGRVQIGSGRVDPVNVFRAIEGLGWKNKLFNVSNSWSCRLMRNPI
jgi:hypothetical protein